MSNWNVKQLRRIAQAAYIAANPDAIITPDN